MAAFFWACTFTQQAPVTSPAEGLAEKAVEKFFIPDHATPLVTYQSNYQTQLFNK